MKDQPFLRDLSGTIFQVQHAGNGYIRVRVVTPGTTDPETGFPIGDSQSVECWISRGDAYALGNHLVSITEAAPTQL